MNKKYLILYILIIIIIILLLFVIALILNEQNVNTDKYVEDEKNVTYNTQIDEIITSPFDNTTGNETYENTNSQTSTISKSIENVQIKIEESTISSSGLTIIITDNNEEPYGWGENYGIQEKINGEWKSLKANINFNSKAYLLDENHQIRQNINWVNSYGKLQKGTYRIEKEANGVVFYSNEFKIK